MEKQPTKLNEQSYVSIGLLILILIGALRVESTASKAENNKEEIEKLRIEMKILSDINTRLARIEGAVGVKVVADDEK